MGRKPKETRGRKKVYKTEHQRKKAANDQHYAWSKKHRTAFSIRLNNDTQADVIEYLKNCPNKQKVIVNAIRDYIKKEQG